MPNNKIKYKLSKLQRKMQRKQEQLLREGEENEAEKLKEEMERQQKAYEEIVVFKHKIKLAILRSKELDKEFKDKRANYATKKEFKQAYKENKQKRNAVIFKLKEELIDLKLAYAYEFETTNFKIKRWFYGMIKEFQRIYWLKKKQLAYSFITVIIITLFLSTLFLIINLIFARGI